jgi:hypothetical protein
VGGRAADQPAGRVAENVHVRVVDRLETARRDRLAILALCAVDAGHDHIERGHHVVRQPQFAVGQNLHLAALQQPEVDALCRRSGGCTRRSPTRWRASFSASTPCTIPSPMLWSLTDQ